MFAIKKLFALIFIVAMSAPGLAHAENRYTQRGFGPGPLDSAVRPAPQWQRQGSDYVRNSRWINDDGYVVRGEVVYSNDGTTYVRRAPQRGYPRLPGAVTPPRNFSITSK